MRLDDTLTKAVDCIRSRVPENMCVGIVLGSGLAGVAAMVEQSASIEYRHIPGFPPVTAPGHAGKLVVGRFADKNVAVMSGRPHLYEGYDRATTTFPIRVLRKLGATILIVTNAAGAVNRSFRAGDLIIITDHIDFTFMHASIMTKSEAAFSRAGFHYDRGLIDIAFHEARKLSLTLQAGTYLGLTGPNYETNAELTMLERIGADAVGMSTVAEAVEAFRVGMKVLGISCIANARERKDRLTHDEVERTVRNVVPVLAPLIAAIVSRI